MGNLKLIQSPNRSVRVCASAVLARLEERVRHGDIEKRDVPILIRVRGTPEQS